MRALLKPVAVIISFAVVGSAASAAFAETQWERNHPRRDQVNDRLANQNRRIDHSKKAKSPGNKPIGFTAKTARFAARSAPWPGSMTATSPRVNKGLSIGRRTPSAVKLGAE